MATTSTVASVKDVSKAILQKSRPISNLKLQKLLYYVQGWNLGLYREPVFYERIEAWVHGPVVPAAFHEYRHFGWNPITTTLEPVELLPRTMAHIEMVLKAYGDFSAVQLESLSHDEDPWIQARGSLDPKASSQNEITHAAMQRFFANRANG